MAQRKVPMRSHSLGCVPQLTFAAFLLAAILPSCSSSDVAAAPSIAGKWGRTVGSSSTALVILEVKADKTATYGLYDSSCTGTPVVYGGYSWTATPSVLTLTGTGTCSGSFTCTTTGTPAVYDCNVLPEWKITGDDTYLLRDNGATLTITFPAGGTPETYTRK